MGDCSYPPPPDNALLGVGRVDVHAGEQNVIKVAQSPSNTQLRTC